MILLETWSCMIVIDVKPSYLDNCWPGYSLVCYRLCFVLWLIFLVLVMVSCVQDGPKIFWCPQDMLLIVLWFNGSYPFGLDICWKLFWDVVMDLTMVCGDLHGIFYIGRGYVAYYLLYLHVIFGNGFGECVSICGWLDQSWKDVL